MIVPCSVHARALLRRFDPESGELVATLLDVKGCGTHADALVADNARNTGLLSCADALREFAMQRLLARVCERQPAWRHPSPWRCVEFYAIIDTGLKYAGVNPATGLAGERCVLTVRQRQSRAFVHYHGYNFSGSLMMTGEDESQPSLRHGAMRVARAAFLANGISSEIHPQARVLVL
jgi:hypothetical protein